MFHLALDHLCYIFTFLFYSMPLTEQFTLKDIPALGTFIVDFFAEHLHLLFSPKTHNNTLAP
jgi:hypothetical protein